MSELVAVGVNHRSAPVELRERLAVPDDDHVRVLEHVKTSTGMSELMVVSTCNRVELYGVVPQRVVDAARLFAPMAELSRVAPSALADHLFVRASGDAARHIFRVAASLDSMVVGEPQILGQLKDSFQRAKESGTVGPILDRCLSLAFKSAKRVRTETAIARGGASVPSVAVELATSIFGDLSRSAVLLIGAGEMAEQSALHLRAAGVMDIAVVNRSESRGRALADKVGGRYAPWERLEDQLVRADVVVTSTGSKLPVIDRRLLKPVLKARRQRPLFLVDIAVPRDVEPKVGRMDHVFLYNVDDLQGIVHDNLRSRRDEARLAESLVDEEVRAFLTWMRSRSIGPLLGQLQSWGRQVVEAELERALARLPSLSDEERGAVEKMGRSIMQKLLHRPMASVRKASEQPEGPFDGPGLAQALAALFELEVRAAATEREAEDEDARPPREILPDPAKLPTPELS